MDIIKIFKNFTNIKPFLSYVSQKNYILNIQFLNRNVTFNDYFIYDFNNYFLIYFQFKYIKELINTYDNKIILKTINLDILCNNLIIKEELGKNIITIDFKTQEQKNIFIDIEYGNIQSEYKNRAQNILDNMIDNKNRIEYEFNNINQFNIDSPKITVLHYIEGLIK